MKVGEKSHGMARTRFYRIWVKMLLRCRNSNDTHYPYYGGKGIKVTKRWEKFENFYTDMYSTYKDGLTLDRKNIKGNYNKKNCRWVTRKEQARNTTANVIYRGEYMIDATKRLGMANNAIHNRMKNGWTKKEAFTIPKGGRRPKSR